MDDRYARHALVPGWNHDLLAQAAVVIIGVGAVGNEVARLLALAGVGRLLLCDHDRVERSNLSRCPLFREGHIGHPKVFAAADALADMVPGIDVQARHAPFMHGLGLAELRDAALTISCLDSRAARLELAGRCGLIRAPWIDGGTHEWGGEVRPFLDVDGPCYGCGLTRQERAHGDTPRSCDDVDDSGPVGATTLTSALVGGWIASFAIRFLLGLKTEADLLKLSLATGMSARVSQRRDPDCECHLPLGTSRRVPLTIDHTCGELLALLPPGAVPLSWTPIQRRVRCVSCGFDEPRVGLEQRAACPRCGGTLRGLTTLELSAVPGDLTLRAVGIAPREILAVRHVAAPMEWIELEGPHPPS